MAEHTLKYKRPDIEGGYLTDKNQIEYYKTIQFNDVIDNRLLGEFNMVGSYVVNKEITKELVLLKKVYTDTYDKSIFCESVKKFDNNTFKFCLNIIDGIPGKGKVTATLTLLEDIERVNGFYKNTNSAVIMTQVFDDKPNINSKILKFFNITQKKSISDGGDEKVETDFDYPSIQKRLDYFKNLNKYYLTINGRSQKELYEKRIKALLQSKNANTILEEFNKQAFHLKGKFLDKNSPNYFKHLNQMIDGILDVYGYTILEDKTLLDELTKIQIDYINKHHKSAVVLDQYIRGNVVAHKEIKTVKPVETVVKDKIVKEAKQEVKQGENKDEKLMGEVKPEKKEKSDSILIKSKFVKPEPVKVETKVKKETSLEFDALDEALKTEEGLESSFEVGELTEQMNTERTEELLSNELTQENNEETLHEELTQQL